MIVSFSKKLKSIHFNPEAVIYLQFELINDCKNNTSKKI